MSGWDTYEWARIIFGTSLILMGLMNLLVHFPRQDAGRADDGQPRHGKGGADPARAPRAGPWSDIALLGLGVLALLSPRTFPRDPDILIAMGGVAIAVALWILLAEPASGARRRRHEAALARRAGGAQTYTDVLDALEVGPPPPAARSPRLRWLNAALLFLFGGSFLALGVTR